MLNFAKISKDCPGIAHHVVESFDDKVFVHGGVKFMGGQPCRDLWKFYPQKDKWVLENNKGPKLSHHCACSADDKLLITVGGFDGKSRVPDVWLYDYREGEWMQGAIDGFPRGAGLSSHALLKGAHDGEYTLVGRLGGIRQQRQASSVFKLTKGKSNNDFIYEELRATCQSRSGHTATALNATEMTVIGGRAGDSGGGTDAETVKPGLKLKPSRSVAESQVAPPPKKESRSSKSRAESRSKSRGARRDSTPNRRGSKSPARRSQSATNNRRKSSGSPQPQRGGNAFSRFFGKNTEGKKGRCPPRKNHIAVPDGKGGIFVQGGEAMAPTDSPYNDLWLCKKGQFYEMKSGSGIPALSGHKCVTVDDVVMCFGGLGDDFMVATDVYALTPKD